MTKLQLVFRFLVVVALQSAALAQSDSSFKYRWNVYGFVAAGSSIGETNAGFRGGGGGVEAFLWKGIAAGADVSVLRDTYYTAVGTCGHAGANVTYHFTDRGKARGVDPFVLFGVGGYFPDEPGASPHGGAGFIYWFNRRIGTRFELRVGGREYGSNVVGVFRFGIAFR